MTHERARQNQSQTWTGRLDVRRVLGETDATGPVRIADTSRAHEIATKGNEKEAGLETGEIETEMDVREKPGRGVSVGSVLMTDVVGEMLPSIVITIILTVSL